jgi:protein-tyrosine-phosphatase
MRTALEKLGYDPNNHRSQGVSVELLEWADEIIVMGNVHEKFISEHHPEHSNKVENWVIRDPHFEPGYEVHREVARQIQQRVLDRFV